MPRPIDRYRFAVAAVRDYLKRGYRLFFAGQFLVSAQAVAFKVLIAWVPVALLAVGVLGGILSRNRPFEIVDNYLVNYFPAWQSERLVEFADELQRVSGTLTLVGIITLVFAAASLFSTLRIAVSNAFREDWHRLRKWTPGFAFDLRMVLQLGVLFGATALITLGAQLLGTQGVEFMERLGVESPWLYTGWRTVARYIALAVPLLLGIGMFAQLYYFVPLPHPPRASVLLGSAVAALLWEIGKYFFTRYALGYGRYDAWLGAVESDRIEMIGETFSLIVAFVLWAYYSGVVLMVGATTVVIHESRRRERAQSAAQEGEQV